MCVINSAQSTDQGGMNMAVNNYLNIEPLSLEIADEMTEKMTDSNSFDGVILEEKLTHNIKYGFIVIYFFIFFIEQNLLVDNFILFFANIQKKVRKTRHNIFLLNG